MTDDAGTAADANAEGEGDDDLPFFQPPFGLDAVPGFCERLLAHLAAGVTEEEITFEGVDLEQAQGVWMAPMGAYDPDADDSLQPGAPADPSVPVGGYAAMLTAWTEGVRRVLREAWGDPLVRTPRLAGPEREPEGILDYMLVAVGIPEAEMWDRGDLCCVLVTSWDGEEGASMLRQILMVLPRALAFGGMSAVAGPEVTLHERLMHGEHLVELHRRAWLMSTLAGAGEVRLRDTVLEGMRCSLQARDGTTAVWTFTDDGRALLLLQDPACEFATSAAQQLLDDLAPTEDAPADAAPAGAAPAGAAPAGAAPVSVGSSDGVERDEEHEEALREATTILVARMLSGVPEDLHELIAARAERASGEPAPHDLEFRTVGDRAVPVISGVAWFDGDHWHVPATLMEIGRQNGFGMDDFGFGAALRVPYMLGGSFSVDDLASEEHARRAQVEQVLDACPYPEQARPEGDIRLGDALPTDSSQAELVEQIEGVAAAWWERSPQTVAWNDDTFRIGGRDIQAAGDRVMSVIVGRAERWNVDALQTWTDGLIDAMSARWGQALAMGVRDERLGMDRRTPLAGFMRATGLRSAPMWWVEGHAVLLLMGMPDRDFGDRPLAIVVLSRPDAVMDIMRGLDPWELRRRLRTIGELAAATSLDPLPASEPIAWDGPPLEGSVDADSVPLVPHAVRGRLRAVDHWWVWHMTHVTDGGRALLMSFPVDGAAAKAGDATADASFAEQALLFAGVPADLLSLVVDRDPGGLYEVVTRENTTPESVSEAVPRAGESSDDRADPLATARSLPAVQALYWLDGVHWRASDGLLRRARAAGIADAAGTGVSTTDPLLTLAAEAIGVPQLEWVLHATGTLGAPTLAAPGYAEHVFERPVEASEAEAAVARLGEVHAQALIGSLHEVLDVLGAVDGARGLRYVLDAALSNPDPRSRREIALWLLSKPLDASIPLSFLTPLNVLFENPTLDAGDAIVVRRLLHRGASPAAGLLGAGRSGATLGGHPLVQLARRDLEDSDFLALAAPVLGRIDLHDVGQSGDGGLLDEIERAAASVGRTRATLLREIHELQEHGDAFGP